MLIKWIRCQVEPQTKELFSLAQERWSDLLGLQGFLGQAGGWNAANPLEACIVSFWQNEESYQLFMGKAHDVIYATTGQAHTYSRIEVRLFKGMAECPAAVSRKLLAARQRNVSLRVSIGPAAGYIDREHPSFVAQGWNQHVPEESITLWLDHHPPRESHRHAARSNDREKTTVALVDRWLIA